MHLFRAAERGGSGGCDVPVGAIFVKNPLGGAEKKADPWMLGLPPGDSVEFSAPRLRGGKAKAESLVLMSHLPFSVPVRRSRLRRVGVRSLGCWGKKRSPHRHGSRVSPVKAHLTRIPTRPHRSCVGDGVVSHSSTCSNYRWNTSGSAKLNLPLTKRCVKRGPGIYDGLGCHVHSCVYEEKWIHERPPVNSSRRTKRRWWFYRNVAKYTPMAGSDRGDHSGWRRILLMFRKFRKGAMLWYRRKFDHFMQWKDVLAKPDRPGRMIGRLRRKPVRYERRAQARGDRSRVAQSLKKAVGDTLVPEGVAVVSEEESEGGLVGSSNPVKTGLERAGASLCPSVESSESNYDDLWD